MIRIYFRLENILHKLVLLVKQIYWSFIFTHIQHVALQAIWRFFFIIHFFFYFQFEPPKSLPHSCDFSQNLTGVGYHTFKLRDKPEWSIGFKKKGGKKLPGFIRKPSQETCHHFSLELLDHSTITTPVDFDKFPLKYDFRSIEYRNRKMKIRHERKKRRRERLRQNQMIANGVNRWTITWFCLGFQIFELGIFPWRCGVNYSPDALRGTHGLEVMCKQRWIPSGILVILPRKFVKWA